MQWPGFCVGPAVGVFQPEMHLKPADSFPGVFIEDAAERDTVVAIPPELALEGKDVRGSARTARNFST